MYYLDTNVCVEFLKGRMPRTRELLESSDPRLFALPTPVVAELFVGVEKSARREENRLAVERFIAPFSVVPFDERSARAYARIRDDLESRGESIGPMDLLIAATAVAHEAVLVTRNVREFKRVEGLRVEDWEETEL